MALQPLEDYVVPDTSDSMFVCSVGPYAEAEPTDKPPKSFV